jgi:uncharacterized protein (TIGR02996 family)
MSMLDDLLADVRHQPEDWARWLVLADWLTDEGDERAELIRLEHQATLGPLSAKARSRLRQKRSYLERRLHQEVLGAHATTPWIRVEWQHGFIRALRMSYAPAWLTVLRSIVSTPTGALLTELGLSGTSLGLEGAQTLSQSTALLGLTRLRLDSTGFGDSSVKALAQSPMVSSVVLLDLGHNALTDEGARALAHSEAFPSLTELGLSQNGITSHGATALLQTTRLRQLDLRDNPCAGAHQELRQEAKLRGCKLHV